MNPTQYRECLAALHWSQRGLALVLGCSDRLTRGWASGRSVIPAEVGAWLDRRARGMIEDPPPPIGNRPSSP